MTPPDTNLNKQRRRHWPVIWGITVAFVLAIVAWVVLSGFTDDVNAPADAIDADEPSAEAAEAEGEGD